VLPAQTAAAERIDYLMTFAAIGGKGPLLSLFVLSAQTAAAQGLLVCPNFFCCLRQQKKS